MAAGGDAHVVVVAETRDSRVNPASFEAIAAARQMSSRVTVVVPGHETKEAAAEFTASGADVVCLEHPALAAYTADGFVEALAAFVRERGPAAVVFAHTYRARDFVPRLAARLDAALVTDCVGVGTEADGWRFTRPMFRGKVTADVMLAAAAPVFVTFQIGVFAADAARRAASPPPEIQVIQASVDAAAIRQKPEPPFRAAAPSIDLAHAERIVAVGRGIKSRDGLPVVESLAKALGAELAASRPICDAGWLPMDRQVGSSGQSVRPRLYVAVGISGAIQHLVGMRGARTVVAINTDAAAPIFEAADYGVVGDLFEVVPAFEAALKE